MTHPRGILLAQLNHKRRLLGCLSDKTFPRFFYRVEHIGADSQQISSFQRLMDLHKNQTYDFQIIVDQILNSQIDFKSSNQNPHNSLDFGKGI